MGKGTWETLLRDSPLRALPRDLAVIEGSGGSAPRDVHALADRDRGTEHLRVTGQ